MIFRIYETIAGLLPPKLVKDTHTLMVQGGYEKISTRVFLGFAVFFTIAFSLFLFFITPFITNITLLHLAVPVIGLVVCAAGFYILLISNADARAQEIEQIIPDVLQIISSNIRAGMTLENAIWSAARPEFGPLKDEIKRVSSDTFSGAPIQDSLTNMTKRIRSVILTRAVRLIVEGIKLGGEMSYLLEEVAEDIRAQFRLHREISTQTMMYSIFIVFAAVIAAPILFSVSVYYSDVNENILQKQAKSQQSRALPAASGNSPGASQLKSVKLPGFSSGGAENPNRIKASDVRTFALTCIGLTTFCAGLVIGVFRTGKALSGLKYAPILTLIGIGIFMGVNEGLKTVFASLLG